MEALMISFQCKQQNRMLRQDLIQPPSLSLLLLVYLVLCKAFPGGSVSPIYAYLTR